MDLPKKCETEDKLQQKCESGDSLSQKCESEDKIEKCESQDIPPQQCESENMPSQQCESENMPSEQCKSQTRPPHECESEDMPPQQCDSQGRLPQECESEDMSLQQLDSQSISPQQSKSLNIETPKCSSHVIPQQKSESQVKRPQKCEVCLSGEPKYKCPACMLRSCSAKCVKKHKTEKSCSGKRDRTKYMKVKEFTDLDLLSDYRFLEELGRYKENSVRDPVLNAKSRRPKKHPILLKAKEREIEWKTLPFEMTKHKKNQTWCHKGTDEILWKIDWIFPEAEAMYGEKISEKLVLREALKKYIDPGESDPVFRQKLKGYVNVGSDNVKVLMKLEERPANRPGYRELNVDLSIRENLRKTIIVEYPTFTVIFAKNVNDYKIVELSPSLPPPKSQDKPAEVAKPKPDKKEDLSEGEVEEGEISDSSDELVQPGTSVEVAMKGGDKEKYEEEGQVESSEEDCGTFDEDVPFDKYLEGIDIWDDAKSEASDNSNDEEADDKDMDTLDSIRQYSLKMMKMALGAGENNPDKSGSESGENSDSGGNIKDKAIKSAMDIIKARKEKPREVSRESKADKIDGSAGDSGKSKSDSDGGKSKNDSVGGKSKSKEDPAFKSAEDIIRERIMKSLADEETLEPDEMEVVPKDYHWHPKTEDCLPKRELHPEKPRDQWPPPSSKDEDSPRDSRRSRKHRDRDRGRRHKHKRGSSDEGDSYRSGKHKGLDYIPEPPPFDSAIPKTLGDLVKAQKEAKRKGIDIGELSPEPTPPAVAREVIRMHDPRVHRTSQSGADASLLDSKRKRSLSESGDSYLPKQYALDEHKHGDKHHSKHHKHHKGLDYIPEPPPFDATDVQKGTPSETELSKADDKNQETANNDLPKQEDVQVIVAGKGDTESNDELFKLIQVSKSTEPGEISEDSSNASVAGSFTDSSVSGTAPLPPFAATASGRIQEKPIENEKGVVANKILNISMNLQRLIAERQKWVSVKDGKGKDSPNASSSSTMTGQSSDANAAKLKAEKKSVWKELEEKKSMWRELEKREKLKLAGRRADKLYKQQHHIVDKKLHPKSGHHTDKSRHHGDKHAGDKQSADKHGKPPGSHKDRPHHSSSHSHHQKSKDSRGHEKRLTPTHKHHDSKPKDAHEKRSTPTHPPHDPKNPQAHNKHHGNKDPHVHHGAKEHHKHPHPKESHKHHPKPGHTHKSATHKRFDESAHGVVYDFSVSEFQPKADEGKSSAHSTLEEITKHAAALEASKATLPEASAELLKTLQATISKLTEATKSKTTDKSQSAASSGLNMSQGPQSTSKTSQSLSIASEKKVLGFMDRADSSFSQESASESEISMFKSPTESEMYKSKVVVPPQHSDSDSESAAPRNIAASIPFSPGFKSTFIPTSRSQIPTTSKSSDLSTKTAPLPVSSPSHVQSGPSHTKSGTTQSHSSFDYDFLSTTPPKDKPKSAPDSGPAGSDAAAGTSEEGARSSPLKRPAGSNEEDETEKKKLKAIMAYMTKGRGTKKS